MLILALSPQIHTCHAANPPNPWGGKWEHVYDNIDHTKTKFVVRNKNNVLIINSVFHDFSEPNDAFEIINCKRVMIVGNTIKDHTKMGGHSSALVVGYDCRDVIIENNVVYQDNNYTGPKSDQGMLFLLGPGQTNQRRVKDSPACQNAIFI